MNIGTTELMVILALALFLYGKNLPNITRAMGKGYREFKNTFDGIKNDLTKQVADIVKDTGIKESSPSRPELTGSGNDSQPDNLDEVKRAEKTYNILAETTKIKDAKPPAKDGDNLAG